MSASGHDEYASVADLYDHVVPYRTRGDVAFFVDAATAAGSPVLELGCGTGRVLVPTARAGVSITGVDMSATMLAVCGERLQREPEAVRSRARLVEADMRAFDLGSTFALVTIPFRPFQHLITVDEQLACLDTVRRHLAPGGTLIVDVFNPLLDLIAQPITGEDVAEGSEFATPDGRRVSRTFRRVGHDQANQVQQLELIYYVTHPDGRQERVVHAFGMRYFFRFEVEHLLARAGFDVQHLYADFDRSPFGSKGPSELIFVARKR